LGTLPDFGPLQSGYDHFYGFRAGVLDYFTHKYGPPSSDTEDLWEDDVKIRRTLRCASGRLAALPRPRDSG